MDVKQLIRGAQRMIPVLEVLVNHAANGTITRVRDFCDSHVFPTYDKAFYNSELKEVNGLLDPETLPMLAIHVYNYANNSFTDVGDAEENGRIHTDFLNTAIVYLNRMKEIVAEA
jgi:hypothetical protein